MARGIHDQVPADNEMTTVDAAANVNAAEPTPMGMDVTEMQSNHRIPWVGEIPHPTTAVMAVVDDNGYLRPIFTASDLLRAFKMIWRTTED